MKKKKGKNTGKKVQKIDPDEIERLKESKEKIVEEQQIVKK
jgi:hypothetical protein